MVRRTIPEKRHIVYEAYSKRLNVKATARRHQIQPQHIRRWKRQLQRIYGPEYESVMALTSPASNSADVADVPAVRQLSPRLGQRFEHEVAVYVAVDETDLQTQCHDAPLDQSPSVFPGTAATWAEPIQRYAQPMLASPIPSRDSPGSTFPTIEAPYYHYEIEANISPGYPSQQLCFVDGSPASLPASYQSVSPLPTPYVQDSALCDTIPAFESLQSCHYESRLVCTEMPWMPPATPSRSYVCCTEPVASRLTTPHSTHWPAYSQIHTAARFASAAGTYPRSMSSLSRRLPCHELPSSAHPPAQQLPLTVPWSG